MFGDPDREPVLTPGERRRLVAPGGGSCLIAVRAGGGPFTAWPTVFERTTDRIRGTSEPRFPHVNPHRLRHSFAIHTLERAGQLPISALARWLAIVIGDVRGSTPDRLNRAAAAGLLTSAEAETLAGAFKDIYELALRQEVTAIRDSKRPSSWIAPRDLDPLTRRHLRESFRAISAVQAEIEGGWKARMRART